jgi:hypothetical protein
MGLIMLRKKTPEIEDSFNLNSRHLLAIWIPILIGCNGADNMTNKNQDERDIILQSEWATLKFHVNGDVAAEILRNENGRRPPYSRIRFTIGSTANASQGNQSDPQSVSVGIEMNSPNWITHQLDPSYPNHFHMYIVTTEDRFGLNYRPSGQMELDHAYLLVGQRDGFPVMIECFSRPVGNVIRCQMWQRREYGFTLSIFFDGHRLHDWSQILDESSAFVSERIVSLEANSGH